jgi:hypothetical protein
VDVGANVAHLVVSSFVVSWPCALSIADVRSKSIGKKPTKNRGFLL